MLVYVNDLKEEIDDRFDLDIDVDGLAYSSLCSRKSIFVLNEGKIFLLR